MSSVPVSPNDGVRPSDLRPTAEYYRRIAAEIALLAERSQLPDIRRELLDLAERFRRMAERRDRGGSNSG